MSEQAQKTSSASLSTYTVGFGLSVLLTLAAYFLVTRHALIGNPLLLGLAGLALVQFVVQLIFFLHVDVESKPRFKLLIMLFMFLVVVIIVAGSLWIMKYLNYHMMPHDINTYLHNQDGL